MTGHPLFTIIPLRLHAGYDVARRLHEQGLVEGELRVAVSGYGQEEDRRRSHEAGFHHHLVKPVELEQVERLLAAAGAGCQAA